MIQPPEEPLEQRLGEARPKKFELHKISLKTGDRNGQYTLAHFWKKWKNEVTGPENVVFGFNRNCAFFGPVTSILTFLKFSQKCARLYRPFWSFCIKLIFLWPKSSITRFFVNCWKFEYLRHLKINHPNFFSASSFGIYLQVL